MPKLTNCWDKYDNLFQEVLQQLWSSLPIIGIKKVIYLKKFPVNIASASKDPDNFPKSLKYLVGKVIDKIG